MLSDDKYLKFVSQFTGTDRHHYRAFSHGLGVEISQ